VQIWRLARRAFCATAADAFSGIGAELEGGRWSAKGTRAVYAAEAQSLAVLEVLVHTARNLAPDDYIFIGAVIPDAQIAPPPAALPADWRTPEPSALSVGIGQAFLQAKTRLAMRVPSVVVPMEYNVLINPNHPAFTTIAIDRALTPFYFDERLFAV
jgi:RES domain-containing protein